jgi:hypothetical protein
MPLTPSSEKRSRFNFGLLFRPWKWRKRKKSEKFEAASRCEYQVQTPISTAAMLCYLAKLQFMGTTPIFAIFCEVIALGEMSSAQVLFLLGRNYWPRYSHSNFPRMPSWLGLEGALTYYDL